MLYMRVHTNDVVISQSDSTVNPRTKVIVRAACVMCAKEFVIERCYVFILLKIWSFDFW